MLEERKTKIPLKVRKYWQDVKLIFGELNEKKKMIFSEDEEKSFSYNISQKYGKVLRFSSAKTDTNMEQAREIRAWMLRQFSDT